LTGEQIVEEFPYSGDYDHPLLAELFDRFENDDDDVSLLRGLIGGSGPLDILECFSGTGRILVPLARDGHRITGLEMARSMNARAVARIAELGLAETVTLKLQDILDGDWGTGLDLVVIGANAFYELPSAETQERCIRFACEALISGGHLFIDNDDYKGDWGQGPFGRERVIFEGEGEDGTWGKYSMESQRFDEEEGILHMKRVWLVRSSDGTETRREYLGRKHPVSHGEVGSWLEKHGFRIRSVFGDRAGTPYTPAGERAIFWAEKR
jgi:hypothetical protein